MTETPRLRNSAPGHGEGCLATFEDHVRYCGDENNSGYYATISCRCRKIEIRGRKIFSDLTEAQAAAYLLLARKKSKIVKDESIDYERIN